MERVPGKQKPFRTHRAYKEMPVYLVGLKGRAKRMRALQGFCLAMCNCARRARLLWLYQVQLCCPFDGRTATIDIELAVDALGMCAESA